MKLIGLIVANLLVSKLIMPKYSRLCTRNIFLRRYSNSKLDNNTAWSFFTCSYSVRAITQYPAKHQTVLNWHKYCDAVFLILNSIIWQITEEGRKLCPFPLTTYQSVCIVQQLFAPPPLSPPNLRTVAKIYNYHGWLRDNWIVKI